MNPTEPQGAVTKQAIEWHQRLDQGEMDAAAHREFSAWLQSPANLVELARILAIHEQLKRTLASCDPRPQLPDNVIRFPDNRPAPRPLVSPTPVVIAPVPRFSTRIAIAATLVFAVLVLAFVGVLTKDQVLVTDEGRWDKQLLEDGSVVFVGPNTRLRSDFDDKRRAVTLSSGEALFQVAKEPGRPFIVTTDAGSVQALGTSFATADVGEEVIVTVASGKVAVSSVASEGEVGGQPMVSELVALGANQQVVLSSIGISEPMTVNADRELVWIRNWYEYRGEELGEIIEQMNRRNKVKVIVDDPQLMRLHVNSLAFKPSEPEKLVEIINRLYAKPPQRGDVLHLERP